MRASFGTTANRTGVPNVCQALSSKLIAQTQAPLGTKFIFVASNFLAYHHIGINNYGYLIGAFQNAGAPVTSTQRNKEGFNLFCSVQSDRILLDQKQRKQKIRILEQISMVVWTKGGESSMWTVGDCWSASGRNQWKFIFQRSGKDKLVFMCSSHNIVY